MYVLLAFMSLLIFAASGAAGKSGALAGTSVLMILFLVVLLVP